MSVFVRASLQGPPKTSPGHVALHHMPGATVPYPTPALCLNPQNLQSPPHAKAHTAGLKPLPLGFKPLPLGFKPLPLGLPSQARLVL